MKYTMNRNHLNHCNYTYLLQCADGTLYCGWTNHLEKRIASHNAGTGAKYTRSRRPVKLVWCESFLTKQEAMRREYRVKRMPRAKKQQLIDSFQGAIESNDFLHEQEC